MIPKDCSSGDDDDDDDNDRSDLPLVFKRTKKQVK